MTQYTSLDSELVASVYASEENILIREGKGKGITYIFFSGNGLFFPNTDECFEKTVMKQNRFEWTNVARSVEKRAERIIFVRDVYKKWYIRGVSERYPDVESLCKRLKERSVGDIYTVGNSAGAYMAILAGYLTGAKYVFAFNPQTDLTLVDPLDHPSIVAYATSGAPYCKLQELDVSSRVFVFYAARNGADVMHCDLIKGNENYKLYPFDETIHGKTMLAVNYPFVLNHPEAIEKISVSAPVSAREFLMRSCGKGKGTALYLKSIVTRAIGKLKNR